MAAPITIRFATDSASAKAGMQDLAAAVLSNMTKVSGVVAGLGGKVWKSWGDVDKVVGAFNGTVAQSNAAFHVLEKGAGSFKSLADAQGGYGAAAKKVAATVAADTVTIGAAAVKAAKDHNLSLGAIGLATAGAARQTQTGTAAMSAAWEVGTAPIAFKLAFIKNEIAGVFGYLARSPAFVGISGGIALYAAFAAAANHARDSVAEFLEISGKARDLGVSGSFLQRWVGEAKELNIEAAKLEAMMKHARDATSTKIGESGEEHGSDLGKRIGEHVKAGNLNAGDLAGYEAAETVEAKYRVVLQLVENLQKRGMQLAALDIGGKMFGSEFENQLRAGVDMVGKMKHTLDSTATTAGGRRVFSDEELRNAEQIAAQTERIHTLLATGLEPLQRDIMKLGQQQYRSWLDIEEGIAKVVAKAGGLYLEIKKAADALEGLLGITNGDPLGTLATKLGATKLRDMLGIQPPENTEAFGPHLPAGFRVTVNPKRDASRALPKKESGGEEKDEIERLIAQLGKSNDVAKAELETVGLTNVEREKALALAKLTAAAREAGREATDEEVTKVNQLAEATAKWRDKTLDAKQAIEQAAEAMREFGRMGTDALGDMLFEGKSLSDVMNSLSKQIGKQLLSAGLTGSGPLAGILGLAAPASSPAGTQGGLIGAVISGFRANGGPVSAGRTYRVNELGEELFTPDRDGRIVPAGGGAGPGGGNVSLVVNDHAGVGVQPQVRRSGSGDLEMIVDVVSRRQAREASRGRGAFAGGLEPRLRG